MCNLSQGFEERGMKLGFEKGRVEGRIESLLIQSKNRFLSLHLCYKNDIFAKPLRHNGFANTSRLELGTFTIPLAMDGQNYEKSSMAFVAIRVP